MPTVVRLTPAAACSAAVLIFTPAISRAAGQVATPAVDARFRVTWTATDADVHDVFCLTTDPAGRPTVSGPGYVAAISADDGDAAGRVIRFADGPATGAQGLLWEEGADGGRALLAVGDAGLIRYRDADGDDRADGPPETVVPMPTGREHHAHAIRRGPGGAIWWAIGNFAGVDAKAITDPASPVVRPRAGVLLRVTERDDGLPLVACFADGFRNAYDFAFAPDGTPLVYDSDGERAVSLPWYRPTRLFAVEAGSDAGWVSRPWKRPDGAPFMPEVVVETGRASPTGVAVTTDPAWTGGAPAAVVFCDWAFGRVFLLPVGRDGRRLDSRPPVVLLRAGVDGFAPTDCEFAGATLFVSVGGRDTRGGVLRVVPMPGFRLRAALRRERTGSNVSPVDEIAKLPAGTERVDLVDRLADVFRFGTVADIERAAIAAGRLGPETRRRLRGRVSFDVPLPASGHAVTPPELLDEAGVRLGVVLTAARAVRVWPGESSFDPDLASVAGDLVADVRLPSAIRSRAAAAVRLLAGDVGPVRDGRAAFDGYRLRRPNLPREIVAAATRQLLDAYPTGLSGVDAEIRRTAAAFAVSDPDFAATVTRELATARSPAELFDRLATRVRLRVPFRDDRDAVAAALLELVRMPDRPGVKTDRGWPDRTRELIAACYAKGRGLPAMIAADALLGHRLDADLITPMPLEPRRAATRRLIAACGDDPSRWTAAGVALLEDLYTATGECGATLRRLVEEPVLSDVAIGALAGRPARDDLPLFINGVRSPSLETAAASLRATLVLAGAETNDVPGVPAAIATGLSRIEWVRGDRDLRDDAVRALRRLTGREVGYELGRPARSRQAKAAARWLAVFEEEAAEDLEDWETIRRLLATRPPGSGDVDRGAEIFVARTCATCHNGSGAIGPDLAGVTRRFVRDDLFRAIVEPDRHVGSRYRGLVVETADGRVLTGLPVSESATGLTLRLAGGRLVQLRSAEISDRRPLETSLMPAGLLDGLDLDGLADLEAYLADR